MPILNADQAKQVVFLKRSMRPGFAGIENELLFEPETTLLFGDAKDTLAKVLSAVKAPVAARLEASPRATSALAARVRADERERAGPGRAREQLRTP